MQIGLGTQLAKYRIYIGNRPPLPEYQALDQLRPVLPGEISHIVEQTGNHWRKIFNLFAKLMFELNPEGHSTWQEFRDKRLLQVGANHSLIFSKPDFSQPGAIHIVTGKSHAQIHGFDQLSELNKDFAVDKSLKLIVAPYFDYRQLSNQKLAELVGIVRELDGL